MESTRSESDRTERAKRGFLTVWTIVGAILLTGVLVYLFNILSVPVGIVIWTVVIVFCLRGPVNKLEKLGVPRVVGTALAYVLMFAVLALVGLLLFSPVFGVGDQFTNLIESIPGYVQTIVGWGNDLYARYADVLARSRLAQGRGRQGIAAELSGLGINPNGVDALADADEGAPDEVERALALLERRPPRAKNQRDAAYRRLVQKGFGADAAASAARMWSESRKG